MPSQRSLAVLARCFIGAASLAPVSSACFGQQPLPSQPTTQSPSSPSDGGSFAAYLAMVEQDQLQTELPAPDTSGPRESSSVEMGRDLGDALLLEPGAEAIAAPSEMGSELIPKPLTIADVIASVYRAYPEVLASRQFLPEAGGNLLAAWGAYDTKFKAHSINEPLGFYETYRHGLGVARQTWWGGNISAAYNIGRGRYQPWYLERQKEDGGEIKVSSIQPLLQGRAIDPQRVAVFQASLRQMQATPRIREVLLLVSNEAVTLYWDWIAAGEVLEAQKELLTVAEERQAQFDAGVKAGTFKPFDQIVNRALIAERRAQVSTAEQKLQSTALKLGLYLRDDNGQMLYPKETWLPSRFPKVQPLVEFDVNTEISSAIARRPELEILDFDLRQVQLDRRLAGNNLLPRMDLITEASQDFGEPATKSDDKGEFELIVGVTVDVPMQLSKARGKLRATNAKIGMIDQKLRLVRDKIATDLQIAYQRLVLAAQIVEQSEEAFRISLEAATRLRAGFDDGYADLIKLNLLEEKANETEIKLIKAQQEWFSAMGMLQFTLGLDPLEQAIVMSEIPPSDIVGPGNLPDIQVISEEELNKLFGNDDAEDPSE